MSIYVLSAGRPGNVPAMQEHLAGLDSWWVIPEEDDVAYAEAGVSADRMIYDQGRGIAAARNLAISHAASFTLDALCVQVSDDLTSISRLSTFGGPRRSSKYNMRDALADLTGALSYHDAYLAGCSPTANAFYASERVHRKAFIVGDLIAIRTDTPLRFDERLSLKEDYDYTLQHYTTHGRVARCDYLLPAFRHRTNPGGAVAYRTAELEQEAITLLKAKWPGYVRDNPRRPNEILLRFPA